jgi:hypothetical protein
MVVWGGNPSEALRKGYTMNTVISQETRESLEQIRQRRQGVYTGRSYEFLLEAFYLSLCDDLDIDPDADKEATQSSRFH